MDLNTQQKEMFRMTLLQALYECLPHSAKEAFLLQAATVVGCYTKAAEEDVRTHLAYLERKGLVRMSRSPLNAALVNWDITVEGIELLDEMGLV